MRFEDKVDYEFKVSDKLDPDEVIIPTMILQPLSRMPSGTDWQEEEGQKDYRCF